MPIRPQIWCTSVFDTPIIPGLPPKSIVVGKIDKHSVVRPDLESILCQGLFQLIYTEKRFRGEVRKIKTDPSGVKPF